MRLKGIKRFHYARDVEEALSLQAAYGDRGALIAGGLDLAWFGYTLEGLIDITGIGLSYVREENGTLRVGATTTLTEVLESGPARRYLGGFLPEVLRQVAVPPLRNQATLGGAAVSAHPWGDTPTALVVLGAQARWADGAGEHRAPVEELWADPAYRRLMKRALLLELSFPAWEGGFAFEKVTRSAYDVALLNAAAGIGLADGEIAWARVVVGATPHRASRLTAVEELLVGREPEEGLWREVRELVPTQIAVASDKRASADWRREVAGPVVARVVAEAARRATGGGHG